MKRSVGVFALIGDVVASRDAPSRTHLQRLLNDVLATVTAEVSHVQPLAPTVGDEFQGVFEDFGRASRAGLLVRLILLPRHDVRIGIGFGFIDIVDSVSRPMIQDGSAWWSARAAVNELGRKSMRDRRTWLSSDPTTASATAELYRALNAHLTCRDALVDRLGDRGRTILLGSLRGQTQAQLSEQLGVTQGAVSQQFARGVSAIRDSQQMLEAAL